MLLTEDQLRDWLGYARRADLERVLDSRGIPWLPGRDGRICTTLAAIERGLGLARGDGGETRRVPEFR